MANVEVDEPRASIYVSSEYKVSYYPPHISTAVELARAAGIRGDRLLIVGGTAFNLLTSPDLESVPWHNEKGELRDTDALYGNNTDITGLLWDASVMLGQNGLPMAKVEVQSDFRKQVALTAKGDYLTYKRLAYEVDPIIFSPVTVMVNGVDIPVARPQTLYYLFELFSGHFDRPKDVERAQILKENFPITPGDIEYKTFQTFFQLRNRYYPHSMQRYRQWQQRNLQGIDENARRAKRIRKVLSPIAYEIEAKMAEAALPPKYKKPDWLYQ